MPNGDGRAIGQQNFAINLTPLHAENEDETLYIKNSSIFDNPERKYDIPLYTKILKEAGATKVWTEPLYGWANQPEVVIFTGLSEHEAEKALKQGVSFLTDKDPTYKMWFPLIHSKDAHWDDAALYAETTGSPSPTFNEGITGQDGPSDSPTNSNFSAETRPYKFRGHANTYHLLTDNGKATRCGMSGMSIRFMQDYGGVGDRTLCGSCNPESKSAETFESMQRYSPSKSDVDAARRKIKANSSWGEVVYDRYLVNQQGSSNKFYYTAIAEKDGRFYPLGAWGRIGYMNTVKIYNALGKTENPSAHLPTMKGAYNVVKDKEMSKINARKSEKRYVDSTLTKWDAESLSEIEGPTAEATAGGLHSPSSFDITWEDGTGQSSASIPPNEIAWAENTGFPTWAKLGAGIAVLYGVGKVITARVSEQKSADNAVKARKGCCGKSAEAKTVRKNSEFSVGQINPVVVEGESDVHGAEEVKLSKPHQGPQSTHYSNERPSQKMW